MPDITTFETQYLVENYGQSTAEPFTAEQIIELLKTRIEDRNDTEVPEAYRGGIRPTQIPTH